MFEDQHLRVPRSRKQKPWSAAEQLGAYWLEQFLSSPESLQITQEVNSLLKKTQKASWWQRQLSGGRWGTMSLWCTTRYRLLVLVAMYCAIAAFPTRGHPKLCTSTCTLNFCRSRNPPIAERAPPRLCPVARTEAEGCSLSSSATLVLTFSSMMRQSSRKPTCTSQPLQPEQGTSSKLKSSIQFWMLADPRKETRIWLYLGKQATKQLATVTSLVMWLTF